ncbi:MAG: dihydrofolate reductase [Chloroflexi bacterium]|nr:dihydrofolate reductase [Chloroflexota bacterium]
MTEKSRISFVLAYDRDRAIGKDNKLPWRAPADMRRFRDLTRGKPVVMGRRTYESIGKPLPKRVNIVMTRDADFHPDGVLVARTADEAVALAGDVPEIAVIGGSQVFSEFLPRADVLYLTEIEGRFHGDRFFPALDLTEWRQTEHSVHEPEADDPLRYRYLTLERIR